MKKTLKLLFTSLVLSYSGSVLNAQILIPVGNSSESFSNMGGFTTKVLHSDTNSFKQRIKVHGFYYMPVTIDETEYKQLYFSNGSTLWNVGEPQLPTISQLIAIPNGADYEITITEIEWEDIEIGMIFPAQKQTLESEPAADFYIKDSIYAQDIYSNPLLKVSPEQSWRKIRNIIIEVCPFKYHPIEKKLSVLKNFCINVSFLNSSKTQLVDLDAIDKALKSRMFSNLTDSFISDFAHSGANLERDTAGDYDYLIIVGNINDILTEQLTLQRLIKWKAFKGYKTKVVTTQETGLSRTAIKNYICHEHSCHNIKYVLFIGNYNKIPLASINTGLNDVYYPFVKSDYWYGCMDGDNDYEAEIPIGRFSIDSLIEFQNLVNKTISYENKYQGNFQKTLLVAHKEFAPLNYQKCSNNIRSATYTTPLQFSTAYGASIVCYGDSATNSQVIDSINSGMHIVNYRGHGDTYCWGYVGNEWNKANELFTNSNANSIDTCSIYLNVCCQTGNIIAEPCLMETLLRSTNGAIACIAATMDTYNSANDEFDMKLFSKLLNDSVWQIGDLNLQAHIATITNVPTDKAKYNAFAYLCGGDPTLEIWTGTPQTFNDVEIEMANTSVTVSSISSYDFTISVVSSNGEHINNYAAFGNTCTFTAPSESFYVVLNKHNFYPYVIHCIDSDYIQNETVAENRFYYQTPLNIGYDVTTTVPNGNVVLEPGTKQVIQKGNGGVTIKNGFVCSKGAEFVVK